MPKPNSFTLIELVIVIAILAILAAVVLIVLNPAEYFESARDSRRSEELASLNKAIGLYQADGGSSMGSANTVYVSIPDSSAVCANLGLPTLPSGWAYACSTSANYRKTDGTGWIPVNFSSITFTSPISVLPVDPVNSTSTGNYYTYVTGGSWQLSASMESAKYKLGGSNDRTSKDGGQYTGLYELGSNLTLLPLDYGDTSLVGYWKFDEGSGTTAYDASGRGRNGTLGCSGASCSNPQWSVAGKINGAVNYNADGTTKQYISLPSFALSGNALSFSFWTKNYKNASYYQTFVADNAQSGTVGFVFLYRDINTDNLVYQYAYGDGYNVPSANNIFNGTDGSWIFITVVADYTNKTVDFYKNGAVFSQSSMTTPIFPSTNRTKYIGAYSLAMHSLVGAYLDEYKIYNRALSAAEVLALYSATNK